MAHTEILSTNGDENSFIEAVRQAPYNFIQLRQLWWVRSEDGGNLDTYWCGETEVVSNTNIKVSYNGDQCDMWGSNIDTNIEVESSVQIF